MSYQNEQKIIQKEVPQLCIKCKEMYGHETFSNMCSKCWKEQKVQAQLAKNQKNQLFLDTCKHKTQTQQKEKVQQKLQKQPTSLLRRETNRSIEDKCERQRTRQKEEKKVQNKCFTCNKKTGMLGYDCKHCANLFCKFHRLPEQHQCGVDFISAGKKSLIEANPEIKTRKISGIDG